MPLQVIYIPGLGDTNPTGQRLAIKTWRIWGVRPHLFQVNWADKKPLEPKLQKLLKLIDELAQAGPVAMVGASAGGHVALDAFALRRDSVVGLVCIAGYLTPAKHQALLGSGQRQRIVSIRARRDPVVAARHSILDGANNQVVRSNGHFTTIARQLLFGAPAFLSFLKKQPTATRS